MSTDEPVPPPPPDVPPVALSPIPDGSDPGGRPVWTALIPGFLILIVLLIFIAQNTVSTAFQFLGWH